MTQERKKAVALRYDTEKDNAPIVVAAGSGYIADKIIEIAEKSGVKIYKDETTTTLLSQLELGKEIPYELYEVVAQIFAYVMSTASSIKKHNDFNCIQK